MFRSAWLVASSQGGTVRAAWWWVDRWRKSTAYTRLTLEEQGAYRNLLDELWVRGGVLLNDDRYLANVSGDAIRWPKIRDKVLAYFTLEEDGWHNDTHDEVQEQSRKRADRQQRYRNKQRNVTGSVERDVTASPSPSPSPSTRHQRKNDKSAKSAAFAQEIEDLFAYWHERTNRNAASKLNERRRRMLRCRFEEEDGLPEVRLAALKLAVDGAIADPFYSGDNERGKRYWELPNIFRNRDRVEELQAIGRKAVAHEALDVKIHAEPLPEPDEAAANYWETVKSHLEETVPAHNFATWFRPTFGHGWEDQVLIVRVPSIEHRDQLRRLYREQITAAIGEQKIRLVVNLGG